MKKNNKGFSLVELIVVIAIMAILAAVAVVSYSVYVERAQEASDMDYITNVLYGVDLFATEKGVEVQQVVISPEVDGPEDIQLIIGWNADETPIYYTGEDKNEIYEIVGNYKMYGDYEFDNVVIKPTTPDVDQPIPDDPTHTHKQGTTVTGSKESTCTEQGYDKYKCEFGDCDYEFTVYRPIAAHTGEDNAKDGPGYKAWQCTTCHNLVVKSNSGNAIVQLPGQKQD